MNTRQARANSGNRIALGVLIVIVSLFCFLSELGALAGVGRMVSSFLIGFFGLADYAYSVAGMIIGFAVIFNFKVRLPLSKILKYVGLFLIGILALHIYTSSGHIVNASYGKYLVACYEATNTAGGMLFALIAYPFMKLITPVGALSLVCVLFFVVAFFAFFPYIKKNVTYKTSAKYVRGAKSSPKTVQRREGNKIGLQKAPVITDLAAESARGQNLFIVDVEGDPLRKPSKKEKGAGGYNPLYPNAMGNLEDEERLPEKSDPSEKYSARGLARDLLLGDSPDAETFRRFNTALNPSDALTNAGAPFNAVRRTELRNKLGIDNAESAAKQNFLKRYGMGAKSEREEEKPQSEPLPETQIKAERAFGVSSGVDFYSLKEEQDKRFGEMYSDWKPEFESTAYSSPSDSDQVKAETVKREVVKPKRVFPRPESGPDSINETIKKAQEAVSGMPGFQGAVNRAINGEELPDKRRKAEIEAEGYDFAEPSGVKNDGSESASRSLAEKLDELKARRSGADKNVSLDRDAQSERGADFNASSQKPYGANDGISREKMPTEGRIPRAFGDNAVSRGDYSANSQTKEQQKFAAGNQSAHDNVKPEFTQNVKSDKGKSDGFSSGAGFGARVTAENVRQAANEAPPLSRREQELLREQKVRASKDRGLQRAPQPIKKSDGLSDKERVTQVNIEQAIQQATPKRPYIAPPMSLLIPPDPAVSQNEDYEQKKRILIETLQFFDIGAEVTDIMVGPTFSLYTLKVSMPKGRTIGSIVNLENDIAMKMEEESVRILAPIPGRNAVGIEVPNKHRRMVRLSELLQSPSFNTAKSACTFALGKNLYGTDYVCDVKELPHMLIAGATGAGKSCCINSIIISLLYKASPEDVKFILIDPKRVELSVYEGIPHLLLDEIICDVDKAIRALNWAIGEMSRRITFLSEMKYRDIDEYNSDCERLNYDKMPRIVIIVDELADLMSMGKKAVEESINRIARLARATGIHLILATQRPSVDVVSGTIKNNLPTRVAFKVTSGPDSRTILDANGADKLLGNGDLLYMTPKIATPERMQGAFISNGEVKRIVDFIKEKNDSVFDNSIKDAIFKDNKEEKSEGKDKPGKKQSSLPPEIFDALKLGMYGTPISISYLQRKLGLGWNKAARIHDMMADMGYLIMDPETPNTRDKKPTKVVISEAELEELMRENGDGAEDDE